MTSSSRPTHCLTPAPCAAPRTCTTRGSTSRGRRTRRTQPHRCHPRSPFRRRSGSRSECIRRCRSGIRRCRTAGVARLGIDDGVALPDAHVDAGALHALVRLGAAHLDAVARPRAVAVHDRGFDLDLVALILLNARALLCEEQAFLAGAPRLDRSRSTAVEAPRVRRELRLAALHRAREAALRPLHILGARAVVLAALDRREPLADLLRGAAALTRLALEVVLLLHGVIVAHVVAVGLAPDRLRILQAVLVRRDAGGAREAGRRHCLAADAVEAVGADGAAVHDDADVAVHAVGLALAPLSLRILLAVLVRVDAFGARQALGSHRFAADAVRDRCRCCRPRWGGRSGGCCRPRSV